MKITVMGPGGVGGYFGARLAAAGNDVTFVARGAHLEAMQTHGLRLDSEIGALHLNPVKVVADAREIPAADAIIFAVKMRDTESAAREPDTAGRQGRDGLHLPERRGERRAHRQDRRRGQRGAGRGAHRLADLRARRRSSRSASSRSSSSASATASRAPRHTAFLAACKAAGIDATLSRRTSRATLWLKFAMLAPLSRP